MHLFSNSGPAVNEIGDINKITQMGENLFYIIIHWQLDTFYCPVDFFPRNKDL